MRASSAMTSDSTIAPNDDANPVRPDPHVSLDDANSAARNASGSLSYVAPTRAGVGADLPAPLPPAGGTRLPNATVTSPRAGRETRAIPRGAPRASPYYYAFDGDALRRAGSARVCESPAPMPPEGGVLLARGVATAPREIPLREYYFEDDGGAWVTVTFPLRGVGAAVKRGDARVSVAFGAHGSRSVDVDVEGRDFGNDPGEHHAIVKRVFRCRKTHGQIVPRECRHDVRANKVIVRLFKDPDGGAGGYRAWPRVM